MAKQLPTFKYIKPPLQREMFEASNAICECCLSAQGYRYAWSIYTKIEVNELCPWCIADGSAAEKFAATFAELNDYRTISDENRNAFEKHTPSYPTWQGAVYPVHCHDACQFAGLVPSKQELLTLTNEQRIKNDLPDWLINETFLANYEPSFSADVQIAKFHCLHCDETLYHLDMA